MTLLKLGVLAIDLEFWNDNWNIQRYIFMSAIFSEFGKKAKKFIEIAIERKTNQHPNTCVLNKTKDFLIENE